jgi:hypothetical protein
LNKVGKNLLSDKTALLGMKLHAPEVIPPQGSTKWLPINSLRNRIRGDRRPITMYEIYVAFGWDAPEKRVIR